MCLCILLLHVCTICLSAVDVGVVKDCWPMYQVSCLQQASTFHLYITRNLSFRRDMSQDCVEMGRLPNTAVQSPGFCLNSRRLRTILPTISGLLQAIRWTECDLKNVLLIGFRRP